MKSQPPPTSILGTVLNRTYRVERLLGEGGMGAVYEASHVRVPRRFAIKVLRHSVSRRPEVAARFKREAMIGSRLGHEHIVQVFDFDRTPEGAAYIVMELLSGEDLAQILRRDGALAVERAASIVRQVALALSAAHENGVVHRDLKPDNVFVCRRPGSGEIAKVLDFGISKVLASASVVTQESVVMGTPSYMSPEQALGRVHEIDARTDLFSLGLVFYEMLAGERAFIGDSMQSLIAQVIGKMPAPIRQVRPDVPPEVEQLIIKAIQKEQENRYQSAKDLIADLAAAMGPRWKTVLAWQVAPEVAGERVAVPLDQVPTKPEIDFDQLDTVIPQQPPTQLEDTMPDGPAAIGQVTAPPANTTLSGGAAEIATVREIPAPRTPSRRQLVIVAAVVLVAAVTTFLLVQGTTSTPGDAPAPVVAASGVARDGHQGSPPPATGAPADMATWAGDTTPSALQAPPPQSQPAEVPKAPPKPVAQPAAEVSTQAKGPPRATRRARSGLRVFTVSKGQPTWAYVYLDGKKIGPSPVVLNKVKPGAHLVEVRREGWRARPRKITLKPGKTESLLIDLER